MSNDSPKAIAYRLRAGGHSLRGFDPDDIYELGKLSKPDARSVMRFIEAGRWNDALKATYNSVVHFDTDERKTWAKNNPGMATWIGVYAAIEDLNPMPDTTGIDAIEHP